MNITISFTDTFRVERYIFCVQLLITQCQQWLYSSLYLDYRHQTLGFSYPAKNGIADQTDTTGALGRHFPGARRD